MRNRLKRTQGSAGWVFRRTVAAVLHSSRSDWRWRDTCQDDQLVLSARSPFSMVAAGRFENEFVSYRIDFRVQLLRWIHSTTCSVGGDKGQSDISDPSICVVRVFRIVRQGARNVL